MSKYTFTFKKDNIFVEFTTEDRDVVERQFQIWVADADEYARKNKPNVQKERTINTVVKEAEKPKEEAKVQQEEKPVEQPKIESEQITVEQEAKPEAEVSAEAVSEETEEPVFDKASNLLKTINSIQNEGVIEEQQETSETEKPAEGVDFEAVLEQTIENPTFEPEKPKDQVFLNLINSKHTTDKFHHLIITAYYLSEFEKMERFSLKQINAKLMQNLSELIDHAMLQEAINQNFIELIPDLTGVSEVGEYRLTRSGEEFFAKI